MAGFWELPMWEAENRDSLRSQREGGSTDGILLDRLLGRVRHTITSNRLEVAVFSGRMNRRMARSREKWIALGELARLPITTITRKALRLSPAQE
jgi:adenine-specific DNA glycosylase